MYTQPYEYVYIICDQIWFDQHSHHSNPDCGIVYAHHLFLCSLTTTIVLIFFICLCFFYALVLPINLRDSLIEKGSINQNIYILYVHTVYPHHPVIHICTFLTQIIFARLSMTSLICIDSAYAVAWHAYSTKPPQGRASADCLMNFLMNKLTSSMQTKV